MIIQKGTTRAVFNKHEIQLKPESMDALDRLVRVYLERIAEHAVEADYKRLAADEILLLGVPQTPPTALSGAEAQDHTPKPQKANPSKIPGPCSRCVGLPAAAVRIARIISAEISDEAKSLYEEELRGT